MFIAIGTHVTTNAQRTYFPTPEKGQVVSEGADDYVVVRWKDGSISEENTRNLQIK